MTTRMGPTAAERKKAQLKRLKEKYGDRPEEELQQLAREAFAKKLAGKKTVAAK